jgi:pimeloyl-ACP methyl ester carboxylesterase
MTSGTPRTQYLPRPGGRVAFDDTGGNGPLVIAAPGMGDTRATYRHLRPLLTGEGLRFVTMDLRGLGESDTGFADYSDEAVAADYLALVDHLDAGPAVLVGNSLSCASAVIAAADSPDRVAGIALLGPFVRPVQLAWWQRALFTAMLAGPWGRSAWVAYYRRALYPGPRPADHDQHAAAVKAMLAQPGRMAAFRELAGNTHAGAGARLDAVTVPAVVVMGTDDPDFPDPVAEARQIADILDADLLLPDGSGHYPQADQPDAVAPAVIVLAATRP